MKINQSSYCVKTKEVVAVPAVELLRVEAVEDKREEAAGGEKDHEDHRPEDLEQGYRPGYSWRTHEVALVTIHASSWHISTIIYNYWMNMPMLFLNQNDHIVPRCH